MFAELSERCFGGVDYSEIGDRAALPQRTEAIDVPEAPPAEANGDGKGLRLVSYRPLFSGPAIDRIPELQFQRPDPEIELAPVDATRLGVVHGSTVHVRSNGTSVDLRARVNRKLAAGVARVASEHARDLGTHVEVSG